LPEKAPTMAKRTNILDFPLDEILLGIRKNDRVMLGRAITLIESRHPSHQVKGNQILSALMKDPRPTFRIAISGSPGVGKSTFIEQLGIHLIEKGHKVAVLSIDPSSDVNSGSILGDKTRMERLSIHPSAFIRPSPAGDFLGGIAWRTREAITLCEAAGYDIVIVETVGVGQSEFKVRNMVDCFFLLLAPGGGDELQGIKKGIVEIADIIAVNKCDGDLQKAAESTRKEYSQAIHLSPAKSNGWSQKVINTSGITGNGIPEAWELILAFQNMVQENKWLDKNRQEQKIIWFKERLAIAIHQYVDGLSSKEEIAELEKEIKEGNIDPIKGVDQVMKKIRS